MKYRLSFIALFLILLNLSAQQITGRWTGNLNINDVVLPVVISINNADGTYSSTFESPKQTNQVFPIQETSYLNNELILNAENLGIKITGKLVAEQLDCIFKQGSYEGPLILKKSTDETPKPAKTIIADLGNSPINYKKIDEYLDYLTENRQAIGSVSIFRNGKEVFLKNFGQNQLENVKYDANTEYHVGSITKMFTAVLLWQQIEKGKLKLTDKLSKFYPQIPNAKEITIQQILNHTSGLGDYVGKPTEDEDEDNLIINQPVKTEEIIAQITEEGVIFQPGERTKYSNSGYFLLSRILEKITGENYNEVLNKNIIQKLNLKNTHSLADYTKNIFLSYKNTTGKWQPINELEFKNTLGLGDITSTTTDLNLFISALFEGKLISKENLKIMMTPQLKNGFGSGMMTVPFYNQRSYGHGGATLGTHSIVAFDEKNNYSLALVTNGNKIETNDISIGVLSIIFDVKDFKFPEFYSADAENLSQYEGTYSKADFPLKITITKSGTELKAQGTGQPSFTLTPIAKDKFGLKEIDFEITFDVNKKTATIIQNGQTFVLTKESN